MAMGQNPVPPVNIPIPTKTKIGGAPTPKWDPIGFDPQPYVAPQVGRGSRSVPQALVPRGWADPGRSSDRAPPGQTSGRFCEGNPLSPSVG